MTAGADLLAALDAAARARHAAEVAVVQAVAEVDRAGVCEPLEGLPLDLWLAVDHHMTTADRRMLLDAGSVLAAMPATLGMFQAGRISWSQVRDVVARVRRLGRENRAVVDQRMAASVDLVDRMDPDQLGWAVQDAVDELHQETVKEREEDSAERDTFLAVQLGLDGRSRLYGELSVVDTATVVSGLDRTADLLDRDGDDASGATPPTKSKAACRRGRAKRRGRALVELCARALDGRTASGGRVEAKPLIVVHVPLDRLEHSSAGLVDVAVPGLLPTLSARTVEVLAADADVQAVLVDGARPLAVSAKVRANAIPTATRLAVAARDMGAREPGRRTPSGLGHVHHLDPAEGHHPENLVTASSRWHQRIVHRHAWHGTVDGDTGAITWTRQGRTIHSLAHHTPLRRPVPPKPPYQPD